MQYKYKLEKALEFSWSGIKGFAYNSKEDFERASAAIFEVGGRHGLVKNEISDRIYLVLEGEGEFVIENEKIKVEKNDVVIVPKETRYDYNGKMRLFLVHAPAYDSDRDIDFEKIQNN